MPSPHQVRVIWLFVFCLPCFWFFTNLNVFFSFYIFKVLIKHSEYIFFSCIRCWMWSWAAAASWRRSQNRERDLRHLQDLLLLLWRNWRKGGDEERRASWTGAGGRQEPHTHTRGTDDVTLTWQHSSKYSWLLIGGSSVQTPERSSFSGSEQNLVHLHTFLLFFKNLPGKSTRRLPPLPGDGNGTPADICRNNRE